MKANKLALTTLFAATMGVSASASAFDITFCDNLGNPFCDGANVTVDAGNLSGTAVGTGCIAGTAAGGLGFIASQGGGGLTLGWSPDYGQPNIAATELSFSTQTWRHIGFDGLAVNSGVICFMPAAAGAGGTSSGQ